MTIIALILIALFAAFVLKTDWWQMKTRWLGTETDARVSWIERDKRTADGAEYPRRFYYVRFLRENGLETEAKLYGTGVELAVGTKVRIRYLPERDNRAVLVRVPGE